MIPFGELAELGNGLIGFGTMGGLFWDEISRFWPFWIGDCFGKVATNISFPSVLDEQYTFHQLGLLLGRFQHCTYSLYLFYYYYLYLLYVFIVLILLLLRVLIVLIHCTYFGHYNSSCVSVLSIIRLILVNWLFCL